MGDRGRMGWGGCSFEHNSAFLLERLNPVYNSAFVVATEVDDVAVVAAAQHTKVEWSRYFRVNPRCG